MKTSKLLVAFAAIAFAGVAGAADNSNLGVSAKVLGNCKITSKSDVAFGNLDPASGADVNGSGSVTFWCTKGTGYTLSMGNGANASGTQKRMKGGSGADLLNYTLSLVSTSGTGGGKNTPITVNASGTVAGTDYVDAVAGDYADTVRVDITP